MSVQKVTATPIGFEFELKDALTQVCRSFLCCFSSSFFVCSSLLFVLTQAAIRKSILEEVDAWSRARAGALSGRELTEKE